MHGQGIGGFVVYIFIQGCNVVSNVGLYTICFFLDCLHFASHHGFPTNCLDTSFNRELSFQCHIFIQPTLLFVEAHQQEVEHQAYVAGRGVSLGN